MKTTLVIMAAGLGSRYGGNKQVDGIGPSGEILMQYSIYDAIKAGFKKIVFIIKEEEHREIIEQFCKGIKDAEIEFVYQNYSSIPSFYKVPENRVKPFGTLHAVLCSKDAVNEPFAVINADDYYGREAFEVIYKRLCELKEGQATMVAYNVKNTISDNGTVSRGICQVSCGLLKSVTETHGIGRNESGVIVDEKGAEIGENAPVSMNLWGFLPSFYDYAKIYFDNFLKNLKADEIKAEAPLPSAVDEMIKLGKLEVFALSTDSKWFGVTYKEDKDIVAEKLLELHNSGFYPETLF